MYKTAYWVGGAILFYLHHVKLVQLCIDVNHSMRSFMIKDIFTTIHVYISLLLAVWKELHHVGITTINASMIVRVVKAITALKEHASLFVMHNLVNSSWTAVEVIHAEKDFAFLEIVLKDCVNKNVTAVKLWTAFVLNLDDKVKSRLSTCISEYITTDVNNFMNG